MVLPELGLAFVHIPKTAGRSIETHLGHRRLSNEEPIWHAPASAYQHFADRGMRLFTVVRNPWDRLVSLNHYLIGHGKAVSMTILLAMVGHRTRRAHLLCPTQELWFNAPIPHVLRYERLDEDWPAFCHEAGIERGPLPRINGSTRDPDYRTYYTDEEAARVGELCRWEVERFGYEF